MSNSPIVEIADVNADAVCIAAKSLSVGDVVFDAWGGGHTLTSVRTLKDGTVSFKRDDLSYREYMNADDTITVIKRPSA